MNDLVNLEVICCVHTVTDAGKHPLRAQEVLEPLQEEPLTQSGTAALLQQRWPCSEVRLHHPCAAPLPPQFLLEPHMIVYQKASWLSRFLGPRQALLDTPTVRLLPLSSMTSCSQVTLNGLTFDLDTWEKTNKQVVFPVNTGGMRDFYQPPRRSCC